MNATIPSIHPSAAIAQDISNLRDIENALHYRSSEHASATDIGLERIARILAGALSDLDRRISELEAAS